MAAAGPPPWPPRDEDVRAALEAVYASGDWGRYQGSQCEALTAELAEYYQTSHVSLCCSGTLAVELALRGLGVGAGYEVLLAGYDFPGNFRAIEAIAARPVLVDVDPRSFQLDPARVEAACEPITKAVIVSHLHGGCVSMRAMMEIARRRNLAVVEDACQCPGAMIEGRLAGTWGDAGVLSFGGSKLLTAGRGGAVLTRDPAVMQRIKVFSERGNLAFPLSELQAAVLRPQLRKLDERNLRRAEIAARLCRLLADDPLCRRVLAPLNDVGDVGNVANPTQAAYYKLGMTYDPAALGGVSREDFLSAVQAEGVALHEGFRGFAGRGPRRCRKSSDLHNSQAAAERMTVLHHPVLLEPPSRVEEVAEAIRKVAAALAND